MIVDATKWTRGKILLYLAAVYPCVATLEMIQRGLRADGVVLSIEYIKFYLCFLGALGYAQFCNYNSLPLGILTERGRQLVACRSAADPEILWELPC